jgi:hypothetical protein
MGVEPSEYVKRLPIGKRIPFPSEGIPFWEIFPLRGRVADQGSGGADAARATSTR